MNSIIIPVSVKRIIDTILSTGDLNFTRSGGNRMLAGIYSHQKIQKSRPQGYEKEVTVKYVYTKDELQLNIGGRIDGIFTDEVPPIIEEIKTTTMNLEDMVRNPHLPHQTQVKMYAYMYAQEKEIKEIITHLTYYNCITKKQKSISEHYQFTELLEYFYSIVDRYYEWIAHHLNWISTRNESIKTFSFPYEDYRPGQRDYARAVYTAIKQSKILFAQSPTGTGKTIGTLFPTIKAMGTGLIDKIFYTTAKTMGKIIAQETLTAMRDKGLKIKSITLTAKEKICFNEKVQCNPESCVYAENYYDKIGEALNEVYYQDSFTQETIESIAQRYEVCPFELSLDLSLYTDCIIGDYNYIFDPRVYLRRYFENPTESYVFLIDESHNLPDRAREMFSADISKEEAMILKRNLKPGDINLKNELVQINKYFLDVKKRIKENEKKYLIEPNLPEQLLKLVYKVIKKVEKWLDDSSTKELEPDIIDFYFRCLAYVRTAENFNTNYLSYFNSIGKSNILAKLFCNDPSVFIMDTLAKSRSTIFFSATLLPLVYFKRLLINNHDCNQIVIPSPFPQENFGLFIYNSISTKYTHRQKSYAQIAQVITQVCTSKPGNYFVFFPSYAYMHKVAEMLSASELPNNIMIQERNMTESEKERFLENFSEENSPPSCAFAVMGGIFGEGIDLVGERLIGAIIVGVGLPQLCLERDLIMDFFSQNNENGFAYSYQLPGFNRVMQAVGRIIRAATDKGVAVLIDNRFSEYRYTSLFPYEWRNYQNIKNTDELQKRLHRFWGQ